MASKWVMVKALTLLTPLADSTSASPVTPPRVKTFSTPPLLAPPLATTLLTKPSYMTTKMSAGTATLKTDMFALNVPLGAATVFISSSTGKLDVAAASGDLKMKGMQYGVNYALSKRTVAYWHAGNDTVTFVSSGTSAKTTGFGIGVHHSF